MTAPAAWSRPHPLSVVVLVGGFITANIWPIGVVLIAGGGGIGFETIGLGVGIATVGFGVLGWYMTSYVVTDESVDYRSGVFNRQARSIRLDRIQQVAVSQPVLARVVGLAVVQVSEASADGNIEIRYLGLDMANELTEQLRALARARESSDEPTAPDAVPPPPPAVVRVFQLELRELVRYQLAVSVPPVLVVAPVAVCGAIAFGSLGATGIAVAVVLGVVGTIALPALSALSAVLQHGDFVLDRSGSALRAESGLLSRREVEVRPDRVQTVTVSSGPIARRLGLHEVRFSAATGKSIGDGASVTHFAPAITTDRVPAVVQGSIDLEPVFGRELESVSALTVRRQLVRSGFAFLVIGVPISVGLVLLHPVAVVPFVLAWVAGSVVYARRRFARLGVSLDDYRLVARRGVLQHHETQIGLANVQSVGVRASFFQRRLGLADLQVTTAGIGPSHSVTVPDLPATRAAEIATRVGASAAASRWELRVSAGRVNPV